MKEYATFTKMTTDIQISRSLQTVIPLSKFLLQFSSINFYNEMFKTAERGNAYIVSNCRFLVAIITD